MTASTMTTTARSTPRISAAVRRTIWMRRIQNPNATITSITISTDSRTCSTATARANRIIRNRRPLFQAPAAPPVPARPQAPARACSACRSASMVLITTGTERSTSPIPIVIPSSIPARDRRPHRLHPHLQARAARPPFSAMTASTTTTMDRSTAQTSVATARPMSMSITQDRNAMTASTTTATG